MDELMNIILKILAVLLGAGLGYLGKLAVNFMKTKLDALQAAKLDNLVADLVAAAEQLYYHCDDTGSIRRDYVTDQLVDLGYEVTDTIYNLLESKVFEINLAKQTAKENNGE